MQNENVMEAYEFNSIEWVISILNSQFSILNSN
jgi:hypothetical protein